MHLKHRYRADKSLFLPACRDDLLGRGPFPDERQRLVVRQCVAGDAQPRHHQGHGGREAEDRVGGGASQEGSHLSG